MWDLAPSHPLGGGGLLSPPVVRIFGDMHNFCDCWLFLQHQRTMTVAGIGTSAPTVLMTVDRWRPRNEDTYVRLKEGGGNV